jgi:hypothetical protein
MACLLCRDLCKPDLRHETPASHKLVTLRDELVESIVVSINALLKVSQEASNENRNVAVAPKRKSVLLGSEAEAGTNGGHHRSNKQADNMCDLHPSTANIINCCKELSGLGLAFRQFHAIMVRTCELFFALRLTVAQMEKKQRIPSGAGSVPQLTFSLLQNLVQFLQVLYTSSS